MSKTEPLSAPTAARRLAPRGRAPTTKHCPVKQSTELRRVQEQLEWKRSRIER